MYETISAVMQQQFCTGQPLDTPKPSCHAVAVWRAVHQLLEQPPIFSDPLALRILDAAKADLMNKLNLHKDPLSTAMRVAIAVRSRLTEDERAKSLQAGATQYVILGAGLDTYAYRSECQNERVFEVDLPATQAAKLARLRQLGINPSCPVSYVACNFEENTLEECLLMAGFDKTQKTFVSWLGVVPYLDNPAINNTLRWAASCVAGSTLTFDYIVTPEKLSEMEQLALKLLSVQLAKGGEPLKSFFDPSLLAQQLINSGFSSIEDIGPECLNNRYLIQREDRLRVGNVTRMFKAVV